MEFTDRIAIVTGGASGIGAATAEHLADLGARVVVWDLADGADVQVDVRDPESVTAAMAETVKTFGVPTVLVAGVGINGRRPLVETTVEDWDRIMEVNARGTFLTLQAAAKAMIEAGTGGSIVLIGSTSGVLADPETVPYSVSKAGLNHLARLAAVELGKHGIRVNLVNPGATRTPMTERTLSRSDYLNLVVETTPLHGVGTPELLAQSIAGILALDWVTGQTIIADGGSSLVTPRGAVRASFGSFVGGPETTEYERPADSAKGS
ncbi:SDR family NAD(P)-dependent oxidoreductase [Herbiconiux ginsengi]|uniref:NAD(P)-dependent dehydrogenase, short-chain alcohol dehydrogenase family n=1 Tax=Herbiconiux ginsengi TaxID=381665 RepID=A0A1H3TG67_9MICO|nr:SDR family oxidoreductase [Herbiconiux ginsengi]SDZ48878.1 NAD(P)-dependent dehydrogenase, short-chain alcohol dehydrogenase family [Herbiconiux ginsengi]